VMGPCIGGCRGSTRSPSLRMPVNGGRERRRCSVSNLAGGELDLEPGNERGNEDVWKVSRNGASSIEGLGEPYIGRGGGHQEMAEVGVRQACVGSPAGAGALEACWHARLCTVERSRACWHAGVGRDRGKRGVGVWVVFCSFLPGLMAGVWAGKMGSRQRRERGESSGTATGARAYEQGVGYSRFDFPDFCTQCPQEFEFRIFEKFHFGLLGY
jgi:hypothetical protein